MSKTATSKVLYHYTSADALLGVLQSGSLWATDIRFLNDSTEFTFAREILVNTLQHRAQRLRNLRVRELISRHIERIRAESTAHAYVVSFSEHGNTLSQWRAYAPKDGVCIGFRRTALNSLKDFALRRCVYLSDDTQRLVGNSHETAAIVADLDETVRWVSRLIQQNARKKRSSARADREADVDPVVLIHSALVWAALRIKHAGFAEESEWRLIDNTQDLRVVHATANDPRDLLKFRRGAFGVTPYVVAKLPDAVDALPLGLCSVTVGPSANSASIVASIRELLEIKYKSSAVVNSCGIPFRAW